MAAETSIHEVVILGGAGLDVRGDGINRGFDLGQEAGEIAEVDVIDGALDGAAVGVANDDDEFGPGDLAGEFHAAEDVIVEDIAGDAGAKDIAHALIKDNLAGLTGIEAAQDHGEGILAGGRGMDLRGEIAGDGLAGDEAGVASTEFGQGLLRGHRGLRGLGLDGRAPGRDAGGGSLERQWANGIPLLRRGTEEEGGGSEGGE